MLGPNTCVVCEDPQQTDSELCIRAQVKSAPDVIPLTELLVQLDETRLVGDVRSTLLGS